ncbi:MAG TPA: alpha/beta fold hydrolase [Myxococcota bacterium]|jgi:alpha/beta superfamily hydrolase|nr:alpha/beta fold hydrolase [Myxococcota bacterium]
MSWKEQMAPIAVPGSGLVLEGVWQKGAGRGAVIAPPHPLYGGSLEHPVVSELAYGLYKAGIASLRFNWRGVGGSQGRITGDWAAAEDDYLAALEQVASTLPPPVIAAGYSFGAAAALRVGLKDPRVSELLLVAPPAGMIESLPLDTFRGPIHVIVGGRDEFAPLDELSTLLEGLPNANLDVIPKADHFFGAQGLAELAELARGAVS